MAFPVVWCRLRSSSANHGHILDVAGRRSGSACRRVAYDGSCICAPCARPQLAANDILVSGGSADVSSARMVCGCSRGQVYALRGGQKAQRVLVWRGGLERLSVGEPCIAACPDVESEQ